MSKNSSLSSTTNKCKRCKNPVQTGLKCIVCGIVSHKSCLNALKTVEFIDNTTVNCCIDNTGNQNINSTLINERQENSASTLESSPININELKIKYLEELLKQKDLTIENQSIAISSLQQQLLYLSQELKLKDKSTDAAALSSTVLSSNNLSATHADKFPNQFNPSNVSNPIKVSSTITPAAVSQAVHLAKAHKVCSEVINLNKDMQDNSLINRPLPQKRSRNILVGGANNLSGNITLKSANNSAFRHFHTTNWDPKTEETAVLEYLRSVASEVQVEKLNSRNPSRYASFKVSLPKDEADKITKPEIWPSGILVNQFFRGRYTNTPGPPPSGSTPQGLPSKS